MDHFREFLASVVRPFHDDGLPDHLAFGDIEGWGAIRGMMLRAARLTVRTGIDMGVFGILGMDYAPRAARACWPVERLIMEDVSCAFEPVFSRADSDQFIPPMQIERLQLLLHRYLSYIGSPWSEARLATAIDSFIAETRADYQQRVADGVVDY